MYKDSNGDWLPDEFYGLHVRPDLKVGDIATNTGTAQGPVIKSPLQEGGHAAFPHMVMLLLWPLTSYPSQSIT